MISSEDDAKNAVKAKCQDTNQLSVSQLEGELDYWLVSPLSENGEPLIGGAAYVVSKNGDVFETSGSLPPHARIEAMKSVG